MQEPPAARGSRPEMSNVLSKRRHGQVRALTQTDLPLAVLKGGSPEHSLFQCRLHCGCRSECPRYWPEPQCTRGLEAG